MIEEKLDGSKVLAVVEVQQPQIAQLSQVIRVVVHFPASRQAEAAKADELLEEFRMQQLPAAQYEVPQLRRILEPVKIDGNVMQEKVKAKKP